VTEIPLRNRPGETPIRASSPSRGGGVGMPDVLPLEWALACLLAPFEMDETAELLLDEDWLAELEFALARAEQF